MHIIITYVYLVIIFHLFIVPILTIKNVLITYTLSIPILMYKKKL